MRKQIPREDAEAIRREIDAKRGFPRKLEEHELVRFGGGRHVEEIWNTTAVAIEGDGAEVTVVVDDADELHVEPTRAARLRAAKEPVEVREDEPTKGKGK
jgi:hypothetical protein